MEDATDDPLVVVELLRPLSRCSRKLRLGLGSLSEKFLAALDGVTGGGSSRSC